MYAPSRDSVPGEHSHPSRSYNDRRYEGNEKHYVRTDKEGADRRSYPTKDRSSQHTPSGRHSRPPTVHSEQYSRASAPYPNYYSPDGSRKETFGKKCSYLCSRRGVLQSTEIATNILVLICVAASGASVAGFTSSAGLGTYSINSAYSPFEGTELQQVRDLDMQYSQMRAPGIYGGVAFSLALGAVTLLFLVSGAKPLHRISPKVLVAELVFDILACIGYIVAVGLYLHFIIQVNSTSICQQRALMYARRGYTWMNCDVQGGDAAVALFGLISACLYGASVVICALTLRTLKAMQKEMADIQTPPNYAEQNPKTKSRNPEVTNYSQVATLV